MLSNCVLGMTMENQAQTPLEKRLFAMYNREINDSHCRRCFEQDSKLKLRYGGKRRRCSPQSFFNLGKNLSASCPIRLAFVGKNSWIKPEGLKKYSKCGVIYDCGGMAREMWNDKSPYWRPVRSITEELKLTLDDVFITNFAKCNVYEVGSSSSRNITDWEYFRTCKDILEKEIQIVEATHVIFLTSDNYDSLTRGLKFGYQPSEIVDLTSDSCKKQILMKDETSKKDVCWWSRAFHKRGKPNLRLLRTRHPQGAPGQFEYEIVAWVKDTP